MNMIPQECEGGFYGNPRSEGVCYRGCQPRGVIFEAMQGYIGAQAKTSPSSQQQTHGGRKGAGVSTENPGVLSSCI